VTSSWFLIPQLILTYCILYTNTHKVKGFEISTRSSAQYTAANTSSLYILNALMTPYNLSRNTKPIIIILPILRIFSHFISHIYLWNCIMWLWVPTLKCFINSIHL